VRVSDAEIAALARRLELGDAEFRVIYTRELRDGGISLRERGNRDCVFYDREESGCRVYSDRPRQCRSWPFWDAVVHSRERWEEEAQDCPGMNQGALHSAETISRSAAEDGVGAAQAGKSNLLVAKFQACPSRSKSRQTRSPQKTSSGG